MAALGGIPISTPTIQNALFRSSSTVEQAAVNRKVQGSNPCSGANFNVEVRLLGDKAPSVPVVHTLADFVLHAPDGQSAPVCTAVIPQAASDGISEASCPTLA